MKKLLPILVCISTLLSTNSTMATEFDFTLDPLSIDFEGEINSNLNTTKGIGSRIQLKDSYISLSAQWKNKMRIVLTTKLEEFFEENRVDFNDDFSLEDFVQEAYIEIKQIKGSAVALIIGMQPIAFAQNIQSMPIFSNNPLSELQEIDEVYGVTLDLSEGFFGLFDQVELATFETENGDLSIGKIDGVSLRLTEVLTDNIILTLSHAQLGNSHLYSGNEGRSSIGLVGETNDGKLVGWIEGISLNNQPTHKNNDFAITAGAMMRVHRNTDIIVEYNYIEDEVQQYALGMKTSLTPALSLGLEARFNEYEDEDEDQSDIVLGLNLTYRFDSKKTAQNNQFFFDPQD